MVEIKFLVFGIEPDPPVQGSLIPSNIALYGDKPTMNVLLDRTVPCLQLARPSPLLPGSDYAMQRREGEGEGAGSRISSVPLQATTACDEV